MRARTTVAAAAALALSLHAALAFAQTVPTAQPASIGRPRIGLVLSGGGARGITHIGVLKVLEEMRIPVDTIAATSMGSIVGGLYAAGYDSQALATEVKKIDWPSMFSDSPPRADLTLRHKTYEARYSLPIQLGIDKDGIEVFKGAIAGANLELWLHRMTQRDDHLGSFDELPIPFRAVATDMVTGRQVVFRSGPLYQAIRASMSVPGLFAPMELGDRVYGDGGLVNNLPVDVVRAMGVDVVIAVNIGTPLATRDQLRSIVGFASQSLNILTEQNVREQLALLGSGDVLIAPDLGDLTFLDFQKADQLIALGEKAARAEAGKLARYSLGESQYASYLAARHRNLANASTGPVQFIDVTGTKVVNPATIRDALANTEGKPFDAAALSRDLETLYGTGDFDRISYRLVDREGRTGLQLDVSENALGPTYLRLGLNFSSDLQGDATLNLIGGVKRTWLNSWGAQFEANAVLGTERSIGVELYQPLGPASPLFVSAYGKAKRSPQDLFLDSQRIATYSLLYEPVGVDAGLSLGNFGEVRAGYRYARYRADLEIGLPIFGTVRSHEQGLAVLARYDRLDDPWFPTTGASAMVDAFAGRQTSDGATADVQRVRAEAQLPVAITNKATLSLAGRFAWNSQYDLALTEGYQLGGFLDLSGLRNDQLTGRYLGFGRLVYTQRVGSLSLIGRGVYAGASFEAGNAWSDRRDVSFGNLIYAGSLFLGLDTYIGPLYFAYGRASTGDSTFYVLLGRP